MSGPWEQYAKPAAPGPWTAYAQPAETPEIEVGIAEDVGKSLVSGVGQGVIGSVGAAGDIATAASSGAAYLLERFGTPMLQKLAPELQEKLGSAIQRVRGGPLPPTTASLQEKVEGVTGDFYEPQTTAGEYAETIGEFAPGVIGGPGGLARRAITQVALPAIGSEAAGQATEGTALEPYARVGGAVAGALTPSAVSRAITPLPISAERQAMVQTLRNEGVDLTAGQVTGSNTLRNIENELGGSAGANFIERQGEQFTGAAMRRTGETANRALPENVDDAFKRVGKEFDDLAVRNTLIPDQQMTRDLVDAAREYVTLVPDTMRSPAVTGVIQDIIANGQANGGIRGEAYQAIRSRLDRQARSSASDPQLSSALRSVREALDDAMERSIEVLNPRDAGSWREARNQYRNLMVVEKASTGAGENAAQGLISPSQLRNATVLQGRRQYARGQGDFAELARAGEAIMKPLPNSGTAGRSAARNMMMGVPAVVGAGAGATGGASGAMFGALAGAAVPYAAGRAVLSRPGRAYLSNQVMAALEKMEPKRAAAVAALLSASQQRLLEQGGQ